MSFLISFVPILAFSQLKYEIYSNCGVSKFFVENKDENIDLIESYDWHTSFSLGANTFLKFKNTNITMSVGMDYTQFSSKNGYGEEYDEDFGELKNWTETVHILRFPVQIGYITPDGFFIRGGITNNIFLKKNDYLYFTKVNKYYLGGIINLDYIIKNRFIIGVEIYKDLTPLGKQKDFGNFNKNSDVLDISSKCLRTSLSIGYLLDFNKKN